jgi:hypothetical protein
LVADSRLEETVRPSFLCSTSPSTIIGINSIDQHHGEIASKSCALSAQDDDLATIKTYVLNAARKLGFAQDTEVTALADGATNCWSVIWSLERHCTQLTGILDWFHIGKKFQNIRSAVEDGDKETLERVKWTSLNL